MFLYFVEANPFYINKLTLKSINYLLSASKIVYIDDSYVEILDELEIQTEKIQINDFQQLERLLSDFSDDICFVHSGNSFEVISALKNVNREIMISSDNLFFPELASLGINLSGYNKFFIINQANISSKDTLEIISLNDLKNLETYLELSSKKDLLALINNDSPSQKIIPFSEVKLLDVINFPVFVFDKNVLENRNSLVKNTPLFQKKIVVTRPKSQSYSFIRKLRNLGAEVFSFPTIEIKPLENNLLESVFKNMNSYDWIVFTSVNAVNIFFKKLFENKYDLKKVLNSKFAVVGSKTAEALYNFGIKPDLQPDEYVAEAVISEFNKIGISGKRFLLPRGSLAREILSEELIKNGAFVDNIPIYDTVMPENKKIDILVKDMEKGNIDYITFTSSSTVENLYQLLKDYDIENLLKNVKLVCIGPVTAKTVKKLFKTEPLVASVYTVDGVIETLISDIKKHLP